MTLSHIIKCKNGNWIEIEVDYDGEVVKSVESVVAYNPNNGISIDITDAMHDFFDIDQDHRINEIDWHTKYHEEKQDIRDSLAQIED